MGLDSVELILEVENAFSIRIPDKEAEEIITIRDFTNCVLRHRPALDLGEVEKIIIEITAEKCGVDIKKIKSETKIVEDLGID